MKTFTVRLVLISWKTLLKFALKYSFLSLFLSCFTIGSKEKKNTYIVVLWTITSFSIFFVNTFSILLFSKLFSTQKKMCVVNYPVRIKRKNLISRAQPPGTVLAPIPLVHMFVTWNDNNPCLHLISWVREEALKAAGRRFKNWVETVRPPHIYLKC